MQFTTILIAAFAVLGASAVPTWGSGGGNNNPPSNTNTNQCSNGGTAYCCNNGVGLLALNCVLQTSLGGSCNDQSVCCQTSGSNSETNCYNSQGTTIDIPINILL